MAVIRRGITWLLDILLLRNLLRLVDGLPAFNILGIVLISCSARGHRFGGRVAET